MLAFTNSSDTALLQTPRGRAVSHLPGPGEPTASRGVRQHSHTQGKSPMSCKRWLVYLRIRVGFQEETWIPSGLKAARATGVGECYGQREQRVHGKEYDAFRHWKKPREQGGEGLEMKLERSWDQMGGLRLGVWVCVSVCPSRCCSLYVRGRER